MYTNTDQILNEKIKQYFLENNNLPKIVLVYTPEILDNFLINNNLVIRNHYYVTQEDFGLSMGQMKNNIDQYIKIIHTDVCLVGVFLFISNIITLDLFRIAILDGKLNHNDICLMDVPIDGDITLLSFNEYGNLYHKNALYNDDIYVKLGSNLSTEIIKKQIKKRKENDNGTE